MNSQRRSGCSASCPRARRAWKDRKQQASGVDAKQIDGLISERTAARARKDFKESDRIRDELAAMGVRHQGLQGRHHLGDRAMSRRGVW